MRRLLAVGGVFVLPALLWLCSCSGPSPERASGQFDETDPLGPNGACYVCHMAFVSEDLSRTHLRAKVTCVGCHGLSAGHANDEDIGATPPDVRFTRGQVDDMCLKCHKRHEMTGLDAPAHDGIPVCTDCHGKHRIKKSAKEHGSSAKEPPHWRI
jgi:predicted CXXCH cytochrome family protein